MATPRSRRAARQRARRRRAQHRARRLALFGIVAVLALVTLILTAFGSSSPQRVSTTVALTPVASGVPPAPEILATVSNLQIRLPIAGEAVTAIGFHGSDAGAMELDPVGRQANEGLLARLWRRIAGSSNNGPVWYQLEGGPGTEVLAVGAAPGTDVYSPVDGTVVSISDYVIDGKAYGSRIDVRPTTAPSLIVTLIHVQPDPSIAVGSPVLASSSKLGSVVDVAAVERQALAKHARARGNNVSIDVHPAAGSLP
jgi:murein DD-endopeptidase MepM/ murein hydrolase activator NlpD